MATREGTALAKAFTRLRDPHLRRLVVELVSAMSEQDAGPAQSPVYEGGGERGQRGMAPPCRGDDRCA